MSDENSFIQTLAEIELALESDPTNNELLEMRETLLLAIAALSEEAALESTQNGGQSKDLTTSNDNGSNSNNTEESAIVNTLATTSPLDIAGSSLNSLKKYDIGDRVLAKWAEDKEFHIAKIESYNQETNLYQVTYLQDGSQVELPEDEIKVFEPHPKELLIPGQAILAIGDDDNLFYEAVIESQGQSGYGWYKVRFRADRSRSEVMANDIFIPTHMKDKRVRIDASYAALDPNAKFVLPAHLRYVDTDSEVDRKAKRLKVRKLHQNFKESVSKIQDEVRVNDWKDFQSKFTPGRHASAVTSTSTTSTSTSARNTTTTRNSSITTSASTPANNATTNTTSNSTNPTSMPTHLVVKRRNFLPVSFSSGLKKRK